MSEKTFFEHKEAITALVEERIEEMLQGGTVMRVEDTIAPQISRIPMKDRYRAIAAEAAELLPAIAKPATGLTKADYRTTCTHAINLAEGGEGLFANFVEQMVESVAAGFENRYAVGNLGEPSGTEKQQPTKGKGENFVGVFDTFCRLVNADQNGRSIPGRQRGMDALMGQWVYHYWTTSMMVVYYRWGAVRVPELNYRSVQVPIEMEFLDPLRVDLDDHRTKGIVWYELPQKDVQRIQNEVRQTYGGDPSKHPLFLDYPKKSLGNDPKQTVPVKQNVPQNVFNAEEAYAELTRNRRLPLVSENVKVYRRTYNSNAVYPQPFGARIFAAVNDKRMLRAMDRSLIRKVIMMILQVSVGSPDPKRPVREPDLIKTKERIEEQLTADPEYLQILTTPGDTHISWIIPDNNAILDRQKYNTVDFEILASLVGLISNQLLNTSGTLDMTLIGKTLFQKNQKCLQDFKRFVEEVYDEIILKNNLRAIKPADVSIVYKQISLYEPDAFKTFIYNMCAKGLLPAKTAIEHIGEDYDTVIEALIREEELRQQYNIFLVPPTNNQITDETNQPGDTKKGKTSGPGGRKPGSTDSQPRESKT